MSFSYDIKTKLSQIMPDCEFCKTAELCGIIDFASAVKDGKISLATENKAAAERIERLFGECLGFVPQKKSFSGGCRFEITNENELDILSLSSDDDEYSKMPFDCCKKSYIRGAFIGGGSISDPKKNYHLEFDTKNSFAADELLGLLEKEGIAAKKTARKSHFIIYIKGYEEIAAVLGLMGAGSASMEIYNVSIEKEIRNAVNRRMNCENANIDKVVKAYGRHMLAIEKINNTIGFENLPESLREIARVRMEYPDESLKELGQKLENPIGKSGVNHRLNRLLEIADKL